MKVSIIVPIYNVEKEIERCLLSVISQDYEDIELILVNDCTPDNSLVKAQDALKNNQFKGDFQVIEHSINSGLSAARNSGIKAATGDYLFFLDSDDSLSYNRVISDLILLAKTKTGVLNQIIVGNSQQVIGHKIGAKGSQKNLSLSSNLEVYKAFVQGDLTVTAWGKLVLHSFVQENNLYFQDGIYHEDELWSFLAYRAADYVKATDVVMYNYYEREGSISFSVKEKNVEDLNTVIEAIYQYYLVDPTDKKTYTALKIEKLKRRSLKWMSTFDADFIQQELDRLAKVKTGFMSQDLKLSLQNVMFYLPPKIITRYLKYRWGSK